MGIRDSLNHIVQNKIDSRSHGSMEDTPHSRHPECIAGWSVFESDGLKLRLFTARQDTKEPLPLLLLNHGGGGMSEAYEQMAIHTASLGYAAACLNFRGHYGSEGTQEYGKGEIEDILNLVDFMKAKEYVDENRIGMFGHSRGGHHALLAVQKADVFKALTIWSSPVDVADLSALHPFIIDLVGGTPEELEEEYSVRSPIHFVENITCPVLIIHGEDDMVVPLKHAERLAHRMRRLSKHFELIVFAGEEHTFSPMGFKNAWNTTVGFFNRFLQPAQCERVPLDGIQ